MLLNSLSIVVRLVNELECDMENYHTSAEGTSDDNFRYHTTFNFANFANCTCLIATFAISIQPEIGLVKWP